MRSDGNNASESIDFPLVSIITPSFNQSRFIQRAIDSVRNQTYKNIEHIIVDGESKDGTVDLLNDAIKNVNTTFISEQDNGMYDAINKGLKLSNGSIIAYLNTDDQYFPWTLSTVVASFMQHPGVELLYGDLAFINEDTGRGSVRLYPQYNAAAIRRTFGLPQAATFWRRSLYDRIGDFDDSLTAAAERDYWSRMSFNTEVLKLKEILAADALRSDGLRFQSIAKAEYREVRRRYGRTTGIKRNLLWVRDVARYYLEGQLNLARFTLDVLLRRVGLARFGSGHWSAFLDHEAEEIFLPRLFAANLPSRRRHQGLGVFRRPVL